MYITAGASQAAKDDYEEILVMQGDTFGVLHKVISEKDIRAYIYDIKQLNGLNDDYIYEGQKLKLP